jgi:hypothetical protein
MDNTAPQHIARSFAITQQQQKDSDARINDFTARTYTVSGQFLMNGAGEVAKDISFPVLFTEKPLLSFGADLAEGSHVTIGGFPTVSVVVQSYVKQARNSQADNYSGARILCVTTGQHDQSVWIHYQFTGLALVNPLNQDITQT